MWRNLPVEWEIGWRYLRGGSRRGFVGFIGALSVAGIALGVAALIVVLSIVNGFRAEVRDRMLDVIAHVEWLPLSAGGTLAPGMLADERIAGAAPFAAMGALLGRDDHLRAARLQGIDPAAEPRISRLAERLASGPDAPLARLAPGQRHILLGRSLAEALGARVGDDVALALPPAASPRGSGGATPRTVPVRVAGIFDSGHFQYDDTWALMHRDDVLALGGNQAQAGWRLRLRDPADAPAVADALARHPDTAAVRDWTQSNRTWFEAVAQQRRMLGLILVLIVAVAAFNLVSTLVMTVTDKRADIAILRTLGASPLSIMAIFVVQGAGAGLIGTAAGVALGLALAFNIGAIVRGLEQLLGTPLISGSVYLIDRVPSLPVAADIVPVALVSLALALLATLYPSWRAARVDPAEALRPE